ncbi:BnaA06g40050D [Brassica napus]|uniref:BnaA06g40050D protein n=1 Tax=Brassica napus TaxID=3708 RepID=A0A078J536_BRANA|nr:BnaA06g40050D [Brassica napus]
MLPHSYTVDSLSQSQDLASTILAASTPSAISAACSSVESFLHSHTPDQCRHFFSITFPSLICKIFGFGDATAPSPAQSSSPPNGWIDVISAANDSDLSGRVFSLLSPSGILMSSIFAVDKLSLVKYVFPTERLPEYARFMLSSEKDRTALSNLCPFLKGKIEEGASCEVRVNVFEYYMFWLSYYPVCRGNNESMIPIPKKKMSRLESWTRIKGFPGSSKRDSDQKVECNLYVKILYSYLKAFVPVFYLNAHQPYRSSLLQYGNGYDGSLMARAEFLVSLFVHYWIVENDFSLFPVVTAKSFGVAPPPTCGLEEVVKLLVKYLNLSWVTSGVGSENYIDSGSSFHVANLSLRPLTSWNSHLQRPLYRYILRSFLFCPIGSSIKNASQVFSIWVTYLEPWMISLDDFSDLEAALNGSIKDAKKEESYESRGCGYTSLWQSYVISNYLYYSSLVMHFIGFAHKFLHTDPETITQMVLKVMSILTSSKDLLVLMKNIDKAFHSKQTGPGNSTVNELSRFVPSIREQLKDWEDGLCESNADGSFLHENWNKDLKLFNDCEDGGQQLLQLFILRAEAELQAVPEKNLSEALKCVDSLNQVVSNFFGGHVIKPIAFSLEMDHPQKNRDELFKPRGARNQMASSVKYKGDWMTRPVSEDEVAWMAKLLINISIWLNERLALNQPVTNNDKKENSESVSYVDVSEVDARNVAGAGDAGRMILRGVVMVCSSVLQLMRKYGVRVNLRVMASKKFLTLLFLYVVFVVLKSDYVMQSQQDTITPFQILGGEKLKFQRRESLLSLVPCATCLGPLRWKIHILLNKKLESCTTPWQWI